MPNWFGPAMFWKAGSIDANRFVVASTSVPPRCVLAAGLEPTQIASLPTAIAVGWPRVSSVAVTLFDLTSMRVSVPAYWFVTQTEPPATAMPDGPPPTATVATTVAASRSIRETVASRLLAAQTASPVSASATGPPPTATVASVLPDAPSTSVTRPAS